MPTTTQDKPQSIQMTLVDYFMDSDTFTLAEATERVKEVNNTIKDPSIRARIYEGIDKGLFERVDKGVYTVTRKVNDKPISCMVINGDGRNLSDIPDNSIDAIITDHPYLDEKSHKGGNRNFTDTYDCFQYTEEDFKEKNRVMKKGCFLVEFIPEENANNFEYLYQLKKMAIKQGFQYYAKVPWVKEGFVANTGRKSTNVEEVMIFSKGKARELRIDAKKNKAEPGIEHFMSGTNGMLPTAFEVNPVPKNERIHQAEKPVMLLEQIIDFVSKEGEVILDQFAGSGVLGEAALNKGRNSILIEKDEKKFEKIKERLDAGGSLQKDMERNVGMEYKFEFLKEDNVNKRNIARVVACVSGNNVYEAMLNLDKDFDTMNRKCSWGFIEHHRKQGFTDLIITNTTLQKTEQEIKLENFQTVHYTQGDGTSIERKEARLMAQEKGLFYFDMRDGEGNAYSIEDYAVVDNIGYIIADFDILNGCDTFNGSRYEEADVIFNKYHMVCCTEKVMEEIASSKIDVKENGLQITARPKENNDLLHKKNNEPILNNSNIGKKADKIAKDTVKKER